VYFDILDKCGDFCIDFTDHYLSLESGGIGRHLIFLGAQGVFYFVCIAVIESRVLSRLYRILFNKRSHLLYLHSEGIEEDGITGQLSDLFNVFFMYSDYGIFIFAACFSDFL